MTAVNQTPAVQMPTPAEQGEAASFDSKTTPLFVSPAKDLVAKPGSEQDSWFWVANLETSRGTLNVLVHFLALFQSSPDMGTGAAMVSVLDTKTGTYLSNEQNFPIDQCTLSTETFHVVTPISEATGEGTTTQVRGTWEEIGVSLDLTFTQEGPLLANMGSALYPVLGDITYHYALPTMNATGTITLDGETYEASGPSWLDRQWGNSPRFFAPTPKKWIWFGIMLNNGDRLSVWDFNESGRQHAFATIVHPNGGHEIVAVEPTEAKASRPWTSPQTGHVYPSRWEVHMPQIDSMLVLDPEVLEQEFVSPGGRHKYEASAPVTGTLHGEKVTGTAMIELVGDWLG